MQQSPDLMVWENVSPAIAGGFLSASNIPHVYHLNTTNAQRFVRLNYRLNMPGSNLSGLDLSGADLRGANLSGANLSGTRLDGTRLGGADLSGATMSGTTLAGANVQDLNLDGISLTGSDLTTVQGTPRLTRITANEASPASQVVPALPYNASSASFDFFGADPNLLGSISKNSAMVLFKTNTTVGQLNTFLAARGASILGSSPRDGLLANALLMVRLPTTSAQALYDLSVALNTDPIVEIAAPDVLVGPTVVPSDAGTEADWKWDDAGTSAGGNWGLEFARVPQMWNLRSALEKRGVTRVPTCVIDIHFNPAHADLSFQYLLGPVSPRVDDHGNHVAGIIGATFDNGLGIDGVNPMPYLIGYTTVTLAGDYPNPLFPGSDFEPGRQANGYRMIQDVRDALRQAPETRIINMSLGYNWSHFTNASRPFRTNPFTQSQLDSIEFIAAKYGALMAGVAYSSSSVLIVCAAGNDRNLIPARLASPMCTAALTFGAPNILVVESHGITGTPSLFSNRGGHVAAPGEGILSTGAGASWYTNLNGTSMATPFVSGLAGFLMMADASLTPADTIELVRAHGQNVDAFTSLLSIDNRPGHDREILKMLLDVDDGTEDGCERVPVPNAALGRDRVFVRVDGPDVIGTDALGDGKIDMADFRRWRDWLAYSEGNAALNGSGFHPKLDGNRNRDPHPFDDQFHFPKGDFNGDGKLDRNSSRSVPGWFQDFNFTDIGAFIASDLWEDPCYTNATALFGLIDSVDFHVSAVNFYYKHTDIDAAGNVSVFDAATGEALPDGGTCSFSPDEPLHLLTVPVGRKYFLASAPISIGDGTNVQMRSIGELFVNPSDRGADWAVDLALVEMTAVADTSNPDQHLIDSRPDAAEVEAYLEAGGGGGTGRNSVGARGWATNSGTFYAVARAGSIPIPPTDPTKCTTFAGAVRWERSFVKDATQPDPTFLVKPMVLRLGGSGPNNSDIEAFAEIVVEMRSYDISPAWQPVFIYHAQIAGHSASGGNPSTFQIVFQEGDLPPKTLTLNGSFGAEYKQVKHKGTIDLDGVQDGHSFEVRYRLNARATGPAFDGEAFAYIGDPLDYGSGVRMEYGSFGELPRITAVTLNQQGQGIVSYLSHTNFYYRLYRGADADTKGLPVAMKLGIEGLDSLTDPAPTGNAGPENYTLENQPIDQPLDLDADGIDDVYELLRPSILDPLNTLDAFGDPDADGRSNLQEYLDGTDPQTPDALTTPVLQFPGLIVPTLGGNTLIDINNDGLLDAAGPDLSVALAHLGGSFRPPTNSPIPGIRLNSDTAFLKLDGDAYPDAVVIDSLTNRVFVLRGEGNGGFTPLANYPAIGDPRQIVLCNLNGDSFTDIALMAMNGRGADLHVSNGDGTLTRIATLTSNAWGTARGMALGDLNNDQRDDVVMGYAANAVVFLSQPNGTYGLPQPYPVGSSPESIAVVDLNKDGRLDIVTANRSSGDLSILFGASGGTFLPQVKYTVGALPLGLRVADVNGDTFPDVLVARVSMDYLTVFLNSGNGTLNSPYYVPIGSSFIDLIDWDKDGRLDVWSSASGAGGLLNLGHGDGTFDTRLQIVPTNTPPTLVQAVDLDGDGKLELIGVTTQSNSIDVWEHAAVTGTNRLLSRFVVGPNIGAFTPGDVNGDGRTDLLVLTQTNSFGVGGTNQLVVLTNQGNNVFLDAGRYPLPGRPNQLAAGDFNGDGKLDAAADLDGLFGSPAKLVAFLNNGAAGFQLGTPLNVASSVIFLLSADSNRDGRSEVIIRGNRISGVTLEYFLDVYALDSGTTWTNRQNLGFTEFIGSIQVLDANGDTFSDLVFVGADPVSGATSLQSYPGGQTGFGALTTVAPDVEFFAFNRLIDLSADGRLDVVSGDTIYLGAPGGGFHPGQVIWIGNGGAQDVGDFNRDGKLDLLNGLNVLLQK